MWQMWHLPQLESAHSRLPSQIRDPSRGDNPRGPFNTQPSHGERTYPILHPHSAILRNPQSACVMISTFPSHWGSGGNSFGEKIAQTLSLLIRGPVRTPHLKWAAPLWLVWMQDWLTPHCRIPPYSNGTPQTLYVIPISPRLQTCRRRMEMGTRQEGSSARKTPENTGVRSGSALSLGAALLLDNSIACFVIDARMLRGFARIRGRPATRLALCLNQGDRRS